MTDLTLLPRLDGGEPPVLPRVRQVTLIGANGAGKTRFMKEMIRRLGDRAYYLSALSASFPERSASTAVGSIDQLYASAAAKRPYMRADAVSEIDKLVYMLMADEFEALLDVKLRVAARGNAGTPEKTRLDRLIEVWDRIFPNSEILRHAGRLMFANESGDDPVSPLSLSQGEKAVFYYIAAVLYAAPGAVIFIDSPTLFIHAAIINTLWNNIEALRPDCTFVYNTVDPDFVNSRMRNKCVWIRSYDAGRQAWDYRVLDYQSITDDLFVSIIGSRKPVLFIEGDREHSIDAKLYALVFNDYTVRPLGSCDKVIESTRTFNDLRGMHHLDSHGIVDRDRRTDTEVGYLRRKNIFVPAVAEVENMFLLPEVVKAMAEARGRDPQRVLSHVEADIIRLFSKHYEGQVLEHVRHQMKRAVTCRIDGRFTCITALETHIRNLVDKLRPRDTYNLLRSEFQRLIDERDYLGILRVFNYKPMLSECRVAAETGYQSKDDYIAGVLDAMKGHTPLGSRLRAAVKECFDLPAEGTAAPVAEPPRKEPRQPASVDASTAAPSKKKKGKQHRRQESASYEAMTPRQRRRERNKRRRQLREQTGAPTPAGEKNAAVE